MNYSYSSSCYYIHETVLAYKYRDALYDSTRYLFLREFIVVGGGNRPALFLAVL